MKPILSKTINGVNIADGLEGSQTGLDLSGFGVEVVKPGDTGYFTVYIKLQTSDEENVRFDLVKYFGVFIGEASVYTGDYTAIHDFQNLLALGDQGFGLSLKNPITGLYDIQFKTGSYDTENGRYLIKKEHMFWYNQIINPLNATIIKSNGFETTIDPSSMGTTLVFSEAVITNNMVGCKIFNSTINDWAVIEQIISPTSCVISKSVNWDSDNVYMLKLESPLDGAIGFEQAAEDYGNMCKLEFKFSLPINYGEDGIKQFPLKFSWYKIPS